MGDRTAIAWTNHTFNPWIGCEEVSEGCRNCYARALASRWGWKGLWGPGSKRQLTGTAVWSRPAKWNRWGEGRVFCGSLCDVFDPHPDVADRRLYLWDTIRKTPRLSWQLLTKRSSLIASSLPPDWGEGWPNVWLGVTVESPAVAHRLDDLRAVPARIRFVSYEPALASPEGLNLKGIDWVIYGGETGPTPRPDRDEWARDLLAIARREGVAFFYKQSCGPTPATAIHTLDGKEYHEFPRRWGS